MIKGHSPCSYIGRKITASPNLHVGAFNARGGYGMLSYMERKPTYIRAWRKAGGSIRKPGGYTLDDMVGRLEALGVSITGASLSRIERGDQPYSQDILEAIAEALGVSRADLLENNPELPEAEVIDFIHHLSAKQAKQAVDVLKAMFGDNAESA